MTNKQYNGWANYETWLTNLHFGDYLYELAHECVDEDKPGADSMEEFVLQYLENCGELSFGGASFVTDAVTGFLSDVDWREIAEHANEE